MDILKSDFTGSFDDLRARYGRRVRRLVAFYLWQVDCLTFCRSNSEPHWPKLISS